MSFCDKRFIDRAGMQDAYVVRHMDGSATRRDRRAMRKSLRAKERHGIRKMLAALETE